MELIADILMVAGALGAAIYCYVLAGRLKAFTTLETGMGGAIAVLSAQVDDMTKALEQARGAATGSASDLAALTERAEAIAARLELMVASMHDLPGKESEGAKAMARAAPRRAPPLESLADDLGGPAAPPVAMPFAAEAPEEEMGDEAPKKARFFRRRTARVDMELAE